MEPDGKNLALAHHYLDIDQPQRALQALDSSGATVEAPDYWLLRGQALYDLGRYAEARTAAREGLAREPESVGLLYLSCNAEVKLGDAAAAERAILAALRLAPEDPYLLCRYAHLVAKAGQIDKAGRLVDEAARVAPDSPVVHKARATLSYLRGKNREMGEHSQRVLADDPDDPYGHSMLGVSAASRGRAGDAARHFASAVRLAPADNTLAEAARESRVASHPLMWPLAPFSRLGPGVVWIGAMVIIFGLRALGFTTAALALTVVYLVWCLYSWITPPLLRRWLRGRY